MQGMVKELATIGCSCITLQQVIVGDIMEYHKLLSVFLWKIK